MGGGYNEWNYIGSVTTQGASVSIPSNANEILIVGQSSLDGTFMGMNMILDVEILKSYVTQGIVNWIHNEFDGTNRTFVTINATNINSGSVIVTFGSLTGVAFWYR